MFPLICAKAKWEFEGIPEGRAGGIVAHDMVKEDEEGTKRTVQRGVYMTVLAAIGALRQPRSPFFDISWTNPCSVAVPDLPVYRTRSDNKVRSPP